MPLANSLNFVTSLFCECYIWTYIKVILMSVFFCFRCVLITNALCHLCGVATVMHSASSKKENKMGSKHFWSSGETLYTRTRYIVYFFTWITYHLMHVVENMLVMFHGFISSISNDISNQNALYNFNLKKKCQIGNNYFSPQITKVDSVS